MSVTNPHTLGKLLLVFHSQEDNGAEELDFKTFSSTTALLEPFNVVLSEEALVKELREKKENIISNQIGRSATSVCANIAESKYGHSRADFIAKLEIALKEASETGKWLEMLYKTNYIDELKYKYIDKICSTIRILLISSIKTAKENAKTLK